MKKIKQKPAWSEEDEVALGDALWCCKQAASIAKDENDMGNVWYAEHWLNSLKDRCTWKPSDEQMKALKEAVDEHFDIDGGAKWQKEHLWKPADGDDLPEIDREVIVILDNGKVGFAHRPLEYWDGKDIVTGKVTRYYPKTYDKGGWNIPNVKYWLDVELPKEIEL